MSTLVAEAIKENEEKVLDKSVNEIPKNLSLFEFLLNCKNDLFKLINDGAQKAWYYTIGETNESIGEWILSGKSAKLKNGKRSPNQNSATVGKIFGTHFENHFTKTYLPMLIPDIKIEFVNASAYDMTFNNNKYEIKTSRLAYSEKRFSFTGNVYSEEKVTNIILFGYKINEKLPIRKEPLPNFITEYFLSVHENMDLNPYWKGSSTISSCAMSSLQVPSNLYNVMKKGLIHGEILNITPVKKVISKNLEFGTLPIGKENRNEQCNFGQILS